MKFNDMLKKKHKEESNHAEAMNDVINENGHAENQEQIDELKVDKNAPSPVEILKEELAQANDKYLRLYAEFDNFRRRTIKEREEARKMEGKELIVALLPVLDDFERALKSIEKATDVAPVKEGVILVQNKLKNTLAQKGLKPMETVGTPFDAELQEAITNIPAPNEDMVGKVVDEMEKGYFLNDKVVRFAKVIVGA